MLGTPPALILSQDQTLHKKPYGALNKLSNLRRRFRSDARSDHVDPQGPRSSKSCTGCVWRGPVEPVTSLLAAQIISRPPGQTKNAFRRLVCLAGRRPTDLCATALFSFQGTNSEHQPFSDRITDRTERAWRQSHDAQNSTASAASSIAPRQKPVDDVWTRLPCGITPSTTPVG